ncbi:MAG: glycosyltransferase family 4 protein [Thiohalocapsa sp. PB-PSB1]|jgi:glycosyltransferase involved in cell wall biosynthesis|nr:MAG: hypothetical protein N838_04295 [Thiohalocapsa sp. PB-PSB1]QQO55362.1 MAG: glycosyltransferase family 4 protein [Thiohalocapsa sp. PB-PSB1]HCS90685.1 glycosyltransferase family 1 protein [Chromatiaceae bacterium]
MASERSAPTPTIVIDARQPIDGRTGGIAWVTEGLVRGLLSLDPGPERYCIVGYAEQQPRLASLVQDAAQLVINAPPRLRRIRGGLRDLLYRFPTLQRMRDSVQDRLIRAPATTSGQRTDPTLDAIAGDLIHFPTQRFFPTRMPSVYNPHDLQHLHYPRFFTRNELVRRERLYRAGCTSARRIAVSSGWIKRDLMAQYGIAADKIQVIPWGIVQARPEFSQLELTAARREIGLGEGEPFALYPAATWAHKNHLRLLEALALLRPRLRLKLVCCGHRNAFYPTIEHRSRDLELADQVIFPGVLPRARLDALYAQASLVVIPTLFEASSALLREAWRWQRPVACAAVTSLPEQAGDSALLFDPLRPDAIADAMARVAQDKALRGRLIAAGQRRLARFTWERTAAAYRALYRSVLGTQLTDEDRALLAHDWMTEL